MVERERGAERTAEPDEPVVPLDDDHALQVNAGASKPSDDPAERARFMAAAGEVMRDHRKVFAALAK